MTEHIDPLVVPDEPAPEISTAEYPVAPELLEWESEHMPEEE